MQSMPHERTDPEEMLSANEAGKLLGVSGKTVVRMMEDGEFPGYRIGNAWKFRRGDIEAYRESRKYLPKKQYDDED
jgi:excisionase family DNA binding protein